MIPSFSIEQRWFAAGLMLASLCGAPGELTAQAPPAGGIEGTVITADGSDWEPVADAAVSLIGEDRRWNAATNRRGEFVLEGLPSGAYTLRVIQIGFVPAEVDVVLSEGRSVELEVVLTIQPVELRGVDVEGQAGTDPPLADPTSRVAGTTADERRVGMEALSVGSGMATSGLTSVFSGTPGNDPGDPTDVLFMRGSSLDSKLVLLDGAPIYTPFHVSGLLPAFDPALLRAAQLHNGSAPLEYEGGLAHVLDLRTRSAGGGDPSVEGSLDFLSVRVGAHVPMGERSGLVVGSRGLHAAAEDLFDGGFPYGYRDIVARGDVGLSDGHRLEATAFANEESVALDFGVPSDLALGSTEVQDFPEKAKWGNRALSVGYIAEGDETRVSLRGALSAYDAALPIRGSLPVFADGRTERSRLAAVVQRRLGTSHIRFGASGDVIDLAYSARRLATDSLPALAGVASSARGSVVAAFVDGATQPSPTVRLTGGLRAARYLGEELRLAPHASVTWLFGDRAALSIRAGRSDQLTTGSDAGVAESLAVDALGNPDVQVEALIPPTTTLLSVASASHVVVGLDQFVSPTTRLGLEGWVRRFSDLGAGQSSHLNGSGIDLRVARDGATIEGWFGYSLSWYWSPETASSERFEGRQLLSAGVAGRLAGDGRASLQLSFGDGLPFTAIAFSDEAASPGVDSPTFERPERQFEALTETSQGNPPLVGGPSGDFLRLDAEMSWSLTRRLGSRQVEFSPYVRVLNALNRRDAMFYYFEAWRDAEARPLAELGFMPILGLSWRF